jgi:hypothetical protein
MYSCSYGSNICGLSMYFSSDIVSIMVPYSRLFFSMCTVYADCGSLCHIYL